MTAPLTRYREYSEKLISGDLVERVRGEGEKVIHRYCIFEKDFHFPMPKGPLLANGLI